MRLSSPRRQALVAIAATALVLGCSDSTDSKAPATVAVQATSPTPPVQSQPAPKPPEEDALRITTPLIPPPDSVASQICGLHRYTTEADLKRRFGDASAREENNSQVSMMWVQDNWRLVAFWADGELQVAGASANHPELQGEVLALSSYPQQLRIGESTRSDVSQLLGDGVVTAISWHHGIDIDRESAIRNGVPLRAIEDHCNRRVTYVSESTGQATTLAFRDGILDGGFDDE